MARKNKKISANSAANGTYVAYIAGLVLLGGIVAIMNILANASCKRLQTSIGEKERLLASLEDSAQRESVRFSAMCTPDKLDRILRKHGMAMNPPRQHQIVKMSASGRPYPGQIALDRINSRRRSTAQYKGPGR